MKKARLDQLSAAAAKGEATVANAVEISAETALSNATHFRQVEALLKNLIDQNEDMAARLKRLEKMAGASIYTEAAEEDI